MIGRANAARRVRLAAAGGGGDRLSVAVVDQVACGENPIHMGMGARVAGQDVAAGVEVNESYQQIRARSLTDGHEHRGEVNLVLGGGVCPTYAQPGDVVSALYGEHFGGVQDNNIGLSAQPGSHGSRCAQSGPMVDDGHAAGKRR